MKIVELFKHKKPIISLEIFPPKQDSPINEIIDTFEDFKNLEPDYMSVTYGAGGSKKDKTIEIASNIKSKFQIESMAHITTVGHSKEEIDNLLLELKNNNIENILALKGDPPLNDSNFNMSNNDFKYANELISHIRKNFGSDFCISAACYVEGHVESRRLKEDLIHLKNKVDSGVDFLVTQLFFDNRIFYDFLDKSINIGIICPITPGIMPIYKADQIKRITSLCGASIPAKLVIMMDKYGDNPEDLRKAGIEYATIQIQDLIDNKVDGIHLLSMNRPKSSREILESLNF